MFRKKARSVQIRIYKGHKAFQKDANRMVGAGYEITEVNGQQPNVAIGKTLMHTFFTGGIGLAIGGRAHKNARIMATYRLPAPQPITQTNVSVFVGGQEDYLPIGEEGNGLSGALVLPRTNAIARMGTIVWKACALCMIGGVTIAIIVLITMH